MRSDPLISVILPSYNHENYIKNCLDSIISQDYSNIELNIIDDGSNDNSAKLISDWIAQQEVNIKIQFRSRPNRGISATLNELLMMSSGEYIAGASSDDILTSQSLKKRQRFLEENPKFEAVFGKFRVINTLGELVSENGIEQYFSGDIKDFDNSKRMRRALLERFSIAGPVILFRRSVFESVGGYDESFEIEDWDMYLKLSSQNLLGFIAETVAEYRVHDGNSHHTREKNFESVKYLRNVLEKNEHLYSGNDLKFVKKLIRKRKRKEASYLIESVAKRFFEYLGIRNRK